VNYAACLAGLALAIVVMVAASVTFSTFLSGFVAVVAAIVFFTMGYFIDTLAAAADQYKDPALQSEGRHHGHSHETPKADPAEEGRIARVVRLAMANFLGGLRMLLPDLNAFNHGSDLVAQRRVPPWGFAANALTAAAYTGALYVVSVVVMTRREVAL
jgi:hypothetical protein